MFDLIAIDMDGTLLDNDRKLSEENISSLLKLHQKGVKIVFCTGRPIKGVLPFLSKIEKQAVDYLVCNNGAVVYDTAKEEVIQEEHFDSMEIKKIIDLAEQLQVDLHFLDEQFIHTYQNPIGEFIIQDAYLSFMEIKTSTKEEIINNSGLYKALITGKAKELDEAAKSIPQNMKDQLNFLRSDTFYLEVLKKNVNKGLALEGLLKKLDIEPSKIIAVGDQENDVAMLQLAGHGIAMQNAPEKVKKYADSIGPHHHRDGVSQIIEYTFFGKP